MERSVVRVVAAAILLANAAPALAAGGAFFSGMGVYIVMGVAMAIVGAWRFHVMSNARISHQARYTRAEGNFDERIAARMADLQRENEV
jgi:hypothetical protein